MLLAPATAEAPAADDAKDEMKNLTGTWKLSSAEIDGNAQSSVELELAL